MDNPNGGLAINQLVKMKSAGTITLEQFLELTAGVEGFTSETPVVFDDAKKQEPLAWRVVGARGRGVRSHEGWSVALLSVSMAIYMVLW